MVKRIFVVLVAAYCCYSCLVYAYSARNVNPPDAAAVAGFDTWQQKNCHACHQLYGLGGYMGPDLTNIMSDKSKGALYTAAFIKAGSARMPNFNFTDTEVNNLVAFLTWVDKSGQSRVPAEKVNSLGNYNLENH
jgi:nitric oxide reductase subunit C